MFFHIFKYQLKIRLHDKIAVFWNFIFPIVMAVFFNMAFSNTLAGENFEKVNVDLVNSNYMTSEFKTAMDKSDLFITNNASEEDAKIQLADGKIAAYISFNKDPEDIDINCNKSGMSETIVKTFVDEYLQTSSTVTNIVKDNPEVITTNFLKDLDFNKNYLENKSNTNGKNNVVVILFYSLIAMACMLGSTLGCEDIVHIQANQSDSAARLNVAPKNKMSIFFATITGTLMFHCSSVLVLLAFLKFVLNIDFGASTGYVILISMLGCFTGITMGTMISAFTKKYESFKVALLVGLTLFGSFLSGMMNVQIKYVVSTKLPILSYINPVNLITDGLYSLYYYDTFTKFWTNVGVLGGLGILFSLITCLILRRQKYASI